MGPGMEDKGPRGRKENDAHTAPGTLLSSKAPMSFRLATDAQLNEEALADEKGSQHEKPYGVQSLADSASMEPGEIQDTKQVSNDGEENSGGFEKRRSTTRPQSRPRDRISIAENMILEDTTPTTDSSLLRPFQAPSMSQSLTSLSLDSQAPLSSIPSSPKSFSNRSFRPSDEESGNEAGSQAIISSSDDDVRPPLDTNDSVPQLIMPSIKMPSRRPFTDRGKAVGRLKILVAGDTGVGKTTLIKSIVQTCEDIVHVDALSPSQPSLEKTDERKVKGRRPSSNARSTPLITELYASTKPYPAWWSDVEDTKLLRRRRGFEDAVLERNLCFVDTPGYSSGIAKMEAIDAVVQYVEQQLRRSFSPSTGESDLVGLMSGDGGSQVDVVLYIISRDIKHEDLVFLERLTSLTNVILLISKSDTLSFEEAEVLRRSISHTLSRSNIHLFQPASENAHQSPYTVCSAPSDDDEMMEASLLMSSDYVQPLIPSELAALIEQILDQTTGPYLRHLAATRLVRNQGRSNALAPPSSLPRAVSNPLSQTSAASPSSQALQHQTRAGISPYLQAKIADHTQQEERMAQLRLAKWAADLQRSLQDERARYEALAQGERTLWLNEKSMENQDLDQSESALIQRSDRKRRGQKSGAAYRYGLLDTDDPLGLLQLSQSIRQRGWIALQVAGGFGVLGAVAVWIVRTWTARDSGNSEWTWSWWKDG